MPEEKTTNGRIAYCFFKYALRFDTFLRINEPITPMRLADMSATAVCEMALMNRLVQNVVKDASRGDFTSTGFDQDGNIAYEFIQRRMRQEDVVIDINSRWFTTHLQRFCREAEVDIDEANAFFRILVMKRIDAVFGIADWKKTKVIP